LRAGEGKFSLYSQTLVGNAECKEIE